MEEAVDCTDSHDQDGRTRLRVRVPRRELRHDEHAERGPRGRGSGQGDQEKLKGRDSQLRRNIPGTLYRARNRNVVSGLVIAAFCVGAGALARSVSGQPGSPTRVPQRVGVESTDSTPTRQERALGTPDWSSPPTSDFPVAGGSYTNQRYSTLDQINTANIKKLGGAWTIHLEEQGAAVGNLDGTPVVIGGVMYVTTPRLHVLAIDAATGAVKWRYRPDAETRIGANKGVAVGDGKVFVGRRDNVLVALDQQTGRVVWSRKLTDHPAAYTSAAPVFYGGGGCGRTPAAAHRARGQVGRAE